MSRREIITIKSGKFVFSAKYDSDKIQPLLLESRILYETVVDLPILPELATRLHKDLIRKSIFGTAALEGNPLTEEEVGRVLSQSDQVSSKAKAEKEIRNLAAAYQLIKELSGEKKIISITEETIKAFHKLVTSDIEHEHNVPGVYRHYKVQVGDKDHGGVYTPPKCLTDIHTLMNAYIEWLNSEDIVSQNEEIRSALSHYYLALIHPFGDGNGRTARIVEAFLLRISGIRYVPTMLSNYYYMNMDDYYWAFSRSIRSKDNNITPFLEFVLRGCVESLREIKQRITFFIRQHALRDYFDFMKETRLITQRQHDLLRNLLSSMGSVSIKSLFSSPPFDSLYKNVSERTARRDLKRLQESGLLILNDVGEYSINLLALDHLTAGIP